MTQDAEYILFYQCVFRNVHREVAARPLLQRGGPTTFEMAKAMTIDLLRLRIYWEIRDARTGVVLEQAPYEQCSV